MLQTRLQQLKENLLPPAERELHLLEVRPWYPVRLLALYRLFVAVVLSSVYFGRLGETTLGSAWPALYATCAVIYLLLALLWLALTHLKRSAPASQIYLQIVTDIVLVVLLMHASGGIGSGLGILLVVNIGSATVILSGIAGLFFAALSTILLLAEQFYSQLVTGAPVNTYPQVGALGAVFFGVTFVMLVLKQRVQESELLAEQRELDLENLAQLNEHIIQHMQSGVIVIDTTGNIRLINRAARLQLGVNTVDIPAPLGRVSNELASRFSLWQGEAVPASPARIRSPGSPFELQPHFTPLGPNGEAGTLIVLEDATPYSREFQSLKLASLGRLTASIAHEIRNPLSAIQHASQLLSESGTLEKHDRRLIEIIGQQTERVNTIIENILQLSVKEKTYPARIELTAWLSEFRKEFCAQHGLDPRSMQLKFRSPPPVARFDPTQLHQIVWNLCTNSLKYGRGDDGGVQIELSSGYDTAAGGAYLEIADRGKGVPEEIQDKIFEPFYSGHKRSSGLGLYIVRELCEFNHAQIRYIDKPAWGAVFRIQFADSRFSETPAIESQAL